MHRRETRAVGLRCLLRLLRRRRSSNKNSNVCVQLIF